MTRNEAYRILSDLIFKGFLSTEIHLPNSRLLLKTVNEKEFDLIKMHNGYKNSAYKLNVWFMAFGFLMINNRFVLSYRERHAEDLYNSILKMPAYVFNYLLKILMDMRNESYEALSFLEGFTYTGHSRRMWRALNGDNPNLEHFTGIPGTSNIGINIHQENWMLINRMLDREELYNKEFSFAILIASASNPKGSKKIRSQHDSQMKSVEDNREKLALNGRADLKSWTPDGWAAPVDTVDQLVGELERQIKGVKDKHDTFIEDYVQRMKDEAQKKTDEARKRIEEAHKGMEDTPLITGGQRPLTSEEVSRLINKNQRNLIKVDSEEHASPEDKEKFLKKVGSKILTGK